MVSKNEDHPRKHPASNVQSDPRLFSEPPERDRSIEKAEAEWAWREKIRAKHKHEDELPLFKRQKELF